MELKTINDKVNDDITPFKNVINEWYARDISRKVRTSRQLSAKQGKFMGSVPPYGYQRDTTDKHKLVIDDVSSEIIKEMFTDFSNNISAREIANHLNEKNILTPQNYYYYKIGKENPYRQSSNKWSASTILKMLKNEVYIGHIVQGKQKMKSFKSEDRIQISEENWYRSENMHEAIVDEFTFQKIQKIFLSQSLKKPKTKQNGVSSIFASLLYCMDCGTRLSLTTRKRKTGISKDYRCANYIQKGKNICSPHSIDYDLLYNIVLSDVQKNAKLVTEDKEEFLREVYDMNMAKEKKEFKRINDTLNQYNKRIYDLDKLIRNTFEKNCEGILPNNIFQSLAKEYDNEKNELQHEIEALTGKLYHMRTYTNDIQAEVQELTKHYEIEKLTRHILTSLIQKIYISEKKYKKNNIDFSYDITIEYKFSKASKNALEDIKGA